MLRPLSLGHEKLPDYLSGIFEINAVANTQCCAVNALRAHNAVLLLMLLRAHNAELLMLLQAHDAVLLMLLMLL